LNNVFFYFFLYFIKQICHADNSRWRIMDRLIISLRLCFHQTKLYNEWTFICVIILKAAFAVEPTDTIWGQSLSSKFPVDMNSIFMKLYATWPTWLKGHIPQSFEFSVHSTYANILKNRYKKVRKNVGIGWIG
jgi:hypothetical protein